MSNLESTQKGQQVPTAAQISEVLGTHLANIMMYFRQNQSDGFTINNVGRILCELKWDGSQTQNEIKLLVQKQAQAQVDEIKVFLLKASIETGVKSDA